MIRAVPDAGLQSAIDRVIHEMRAVAWLLNFRDAKEIKTALTARLREITTSALRLIMLVLL